MLAYNHRAYIDEAIEGVLNQRAEFPIELIIGEDWSKDGTREKVLAWVARHPDRIRMVESAGNLGMHENWRRVITMARGEYVAFCEGDDHWPREDKVARQVDFLASRPDYGMVHSHANRYYVTEGRMHKDSLRVPRNLDDSKAYEDILLGIRSPLTVTVMLRQPMVFQILADCPECTDKRWPMADTQLWLECARRTKVGCIHEPLATTNVLPESAGQSRDPAKRLRFYLAVRDLKLHYLAKYPIPEPLARSVRAKISLVLLQHAHDAGDPAVADRMFEAYAAEVARPGLRAHWLRWGSRSPVRRRLLAPAIALEQKFRNLRQRWNPPASMAAAPRN